MDKFYDAADDATDGMPVKEAPEAVEPSLEAKSKTYGCVFGRACEGDGIWLPAAVCGVIRGRLRTCSKDRGVILLFGWQVP